MDINWLDFHKKDHVFAWFFLELVSVNELADSFEDTGKIDVQVLIDGRSVDFMEAFDFLNSQLEKIRDDGYRDGQQSVAEDVTLEVDAAMRNYMERIRNNVG